jgi:murein DD-endopeptidase MepM/ murein hydrolase activator NlpD
MTRDLAKLALIAIAVLALSACVRSYPTRVPAPVTTAPGDAVDTSDGQRVVTIERPAAPGTVVIEKGDTLYGIARDHNVAIRSLIEANGLEPPYTLIAGRTLKVPHLPEYVVRKGDTIYQISRCVGVDMTVLTRTNGLVPPYVISPGQRLFMPPATATPECPGEGNKIAVARADPALAPSQPTTLPVAAPQTESISGPIPQPPARASTHFLWPVDGEVVSAYGPKADARRNNGINIAAKAGTPVHAAENGVVVYAGNELRGYGNLLLVRHADGWTSAYAHNGELLVGRGAVVERGQQIARVGQTGSVTSPQAHFELRKGANAVDPVKYLGPR